MKDVNIELKPKKISFLEKINKLFEDKNKRAPYIILFILPFFIAICIFGYISYKEAKKLIDLATGTGEVNSEFVIPSMDYQLRDNATDIQKEYFAELKKAVEKDNADDKTIAGLVVKNFVADFYTWTNKQGQYDVGGMVYVSSSKTDTIKYKSNIYTKARDTFYKYLNNYINEYGSANLIEVENVEITSCKDLGYPYSIYELAEAIPQEDGDLLRIYDNVEHSAFYVSASWSYKKDNVKLDLNKFGTSLNFIVIKNGSRFEIVEMSEKEIDARREENEEDNEEDNQELNNELEEENEFEEDE